MAIPTQGIKMDELAQETASTLDGSEEIVMFDTTEGKRITFEQFTEAVLANVQCTDDGNGNIIITLGGAE